MRQAETTPESFPVQPRTLSLPDLPDESAPKSRTRLLAVLALTAGLLGAGAWVEFAENEPGSVSRSLRGKMVRLMEQMNPFPDGFSLSGKAQEAVGAVKAGISVDSERE